jgi:hypothetical protein
MGFWGLKPALRPDLKDMDAAYMAEAFHQLIEYVDVQISDDAAKKEIMSLLQTAADRAKSAILQG